MSLQEGYPQSLNNLLHSGVGPNHDIVLTLERPTYTFVGSRAQIINRLVESGHFFVRAAASHASQQRSAHPETDQLDAMGLSEHFPAGHAAPQPPAAGHHPAPGGPQNMFLGLSSTLQTVEGSYIPTATTRVGDGQAKTLVFGAVMGMAGAAHVAEQAIEAAEMVHKAHELEEKLKHMHHLDHTCHQPVTLQHMPVHVDRIPERHPAAQWGRDLVGLHDPTLILKLSLLPDSHLLRLPGETANSLQVVANFVAALCPPGS